MSLLFTTNKTFQNSRSICCDFRQQIDSIHVKDKPQKIAPGMEPNFASIVARREMKSVNKSYVTAKKDIFDRVISKVLYSTCSSRGMSHALKWYEYEIIFNATIHSYVVCNFQRQTLCNCEVNLIRRYNDECTMILLIHKM